MIVYLNSGAGMARSRGGGTGNLVGLGAGLGLNLALSKGEIRLRSNDYRGPPLSQLQPAGPRGGPPPVPARHSA